MSSGPHRRVGVLSQQLLAGPCDGSPSGLYDPKVILLTGGAGFIGSNTLIYLVKKYPQYHFVNLDNLSHGSNPANLAPIAGSKNYVFARGSITSESTVRSVVETYKVDTIMHFAACSHVDLSFNDPALFAETNVVGTQVLLKVANDFKIRRFVHISTDEVYGETLDGFVAQENSPLNPTNPYSASKAAAECVCRGFAAATKLPIVIVRPNNIYGPRQFPEKLIPKFISRLARKQMLPIHGQGKTERTFLFVQDAAEAFETLLHKGKVGETYNIEGSGTHTTLEVATQLLEHFGVDKAKAKEHLEFVKDRAKNDAAYTVGSAKIKALGWAPKISWKDGLAQTVKWYSENPKHWDEAELAEALLAHPTPGGVEAAAEYKEGAVKKVWYAPYKFQAYGEEEIQAVTECLRDGWLAPGPRTAEFESKVAELFAKRYAVMVNSGSSGNMIGLAMMGLQPGDEVVTPACTFSTVVAPLEQLGLKPVFCDVEIGRYVPSLDAILAVITPKTKCVMIPNLVGCKIDWAELRRRIPKDSGIWLFEDSCDTITHTPESDISVISFYASHIITAGGLGGCVMMNDEKLRDKALMFRDWGRVGNNSEDVSERFGHEVDGIEYDFKFLYGCKGYNMKACEMNAAFGLAQLKKLEKFKALRRRNVNRYVENLRKAGTSYVLPDNHDKYDWLACPFMHPDRKGVLRFLEANDIQIRVCFAGNITRHPAYRHHLQEFPNSDRIMAEGFLLGAHHGLSLEDIDRACDLMIQYDRKAQNVGQVKPSKSESESSSLDF